MLDSVSPPPPRLSLRPFHLSWPLSLFQILVEQFCLCFFLSLCFLYLTLRIPPRCYCFGLSPSLGLSLSPFYVSLSVSASRWPPSLFDLSLPFPIYPHPCVSLPPLSLSSLLVSLPVSSSRISALPSAVPAPAQGPPAELHGLRRRRRRSVPLEGPEGGLEEVLASLTSLSFELEQMRRPPGTAERPGLVCSELHRNHPHLPDGEVPPLPGPRGQEAVGSRPRLTDPTWLCGRGILD